MKSLKQLSNLVALPHSVFALPFALASLLLAYNRGPLENADRPRLLILFFCVLAVCAARTAAMSFNRIIDACYDAENPRTANREIPSGKVSRTQALLLLCAAAAVFFLSSYLLGKHCLVLSPFVLGVLLFYSYVKRFGSYAHFVLGLALALAPGGAWWIYRPLVELAPILLMLAVLFWVSGFDVLYSCQDVVFDREKDIFSIPAKFGVETALGIAKLLHLTALLLFFAVGLTAGIGSPYFVGVALLGILMLGQHYLISPFDLRRINAAFFTANGLISLLYFLLVAYCVRL